MINSIRDIQTEADMVEFRESETSVILMTPAWSIYPKKSLRTLQLILSDLEAKGIRVFTVTEDDPKENRAFFNWFSKQHQKQFSHIGVGSGELIICRYGNPIHVEISTSSSTADELRTNILKAIEE